MCNKYVYACVCVCVCMSTCVRKSVFRCYVPGLVHRFRG